MYSETCLKGRSHWPYKYGLQAGGLWWQVQLHWSMGPSDGTVWLFKTGGLSCQWSFKTGFTVPALVCYCVEPIQLVLYINLQLSHHLNMHGLLSVGPLSYRYSPCYRGLHYLSSWGRAPVGDQPILGTWNDSLLSCDLPFIKTLVWCILVFKCIRDDPQPPPPPTHTHTHMGINLRVWTATNNRSPLPTNSITRDSPVHIKKVSLVEWETVLARVKDRFIRGVY